MKRMIISKYGSVAKIIFLQFETNILIFVYHFLHYYAVYVFHN